MWLRSAATSAEKPSSIGWRSGSGVTGSVIVLLGGKGISLLGIGWMSLLGFFYVLLVKPRAGQKEMAWATDGAVAVLVGRVINFFHIWKPYYTNTGSVTGVVDFTS